MRRLKQLEYNVKVYDNELESLDEINCFLGKSKWQKLTLENRKPEWTHKIIKMVKGIPLRIGVRLF